jgi:hypothetical protein
VRTFSLYLRNPLLESTWFGEFANSITEALQGIPHPIEVSRAGFSSMFIISKIQNRAVVALEITSLCTAIAGQGTMIF